MNLGVSCCLDVCSFTPWVAMQALQYTQHTSAQGAGGEIYSILCVSILFYSIAYHMYVTLCALLHIWYYSQFFISAFIFWQKFVKCVTAKHMIAKFIISQAGSTCAWPARNERAKWKKTEKHARREKKCMNSQVCRNGAMPAPNMKIPNVEFGVHAKFMPCRGEI